MNNREFNFKNDVLIGKIGEDCFKRLMSSKNRNIIDVSKIPIYQSKDVDFVEIINKEKYHTIDDVTSEIINNNTCNNRKKKDFNLYEVKLDTKTNKTRNIIYEITSDGIPGCSSKTESHYIIYYCSDETDTSKILEAYSIDVAEWRRWIHKNCKNRERVFLNPYISFEDGKNKQILNFLCKIDVMVNDGVAKKIPI